MNQFSYTSENVEVWASDGYHRVWELHWCSQWNIWNCLRNPFIIIGGNTSENDHLLHVFEGGPDLHTTNVLWAADWFEGKIIYHGTNNGLSRPEQTQMRFRRYWKIARPETLQRYWGDDKQFLRFIFIQSRARMMERINLTICAILFYLPTADTNSLTDAELCGSNSSSVVQVSGINEAAVNEMRECVFDDDDVGEYNNYLFPKWFQ